MAGETIITVVGNLTADPELRFTPSGVAVSNFVIASTPRHFDRQANEWQDGNTLFVRCSLWREAAENAVESLTKGTRVIAQGRLKARPYQSKEGENRTSWELDVDEIGPSLRFATAAVQRLPRKDRAETTGQHSHNGQGFSSSNGAGGFGAGRSDQRSQEPHTGTHGQPSPANWGRAAEPVPEDPWAGQPPLRTDEPPF